MVAANAGDFQCSTNSLGEVTLEQYTPSEGETVLVIPQHVSAVAPWALLNRLWVQTVYLPNKTLHIGTGAFYGCSNLRHVRLSPGTKAIGPLAFSRCVALESVIVPPSCELGDRVFEGCYSLGAWKPWITYRPEGKTLASMTVAKRQSKRLRTQIQKKFYQWERNEDDFSDNACYCFDTPRSRHVRVGDNRNVVFNQRTHWH